MHRHHLSICYPCLFYQLRKVDAGEDTCKPHEGKERKTGQGEAEREAQDMISLAGLQLGLPPILSASRTRLRSVMGSRLSASASAASGGSSEPGKPFPALTDEEWKQRLTPEQYMITRKKGTERAFTGEYWNTKTPGLYECRCCGTPLFDSRTKFDSGTGWPSYYEPIGDNVKSEMDWSIPFMPRTEVLCAKCDAHLGHVFNDGPPPTGKRFCINSASLNLRPK